MSTLQASTTARARPAPSFTLTHGLPRTGRVRFVDIPERRCLAVDGDGAPGGEEFQAAVGALYTTAYALHFRLRDRGIEGHIGHLEGLWQRRDGTPAWLTGEATAVTPTEWRWTLVIEVPSGATEEDLAAAIEAAHRRRPALAGTDVHLLTLYEGHAIEAMHVGPYAAEPETLARMADAAAAAGLLPHGPHHEIYLGDPRHSSPERLRTVLRQPVH